MSIKWTGKPESSKGGGKGKEQKDPPPRGANVKWGGK